MENNNLAENFGPQDWLKKQVAKGVSPEKMEKDLSFMSGNGLCEKMPRRLSYPETQSLIAKYFELQKLIDAKQGTEREILNHKDAQVEILSQVISGNTKKAAQFAMGYCKNTRHFEAILGDAFIALDNFVRKLHCANEGKPLASWEFDKKLNEHIREKIKKGTIEEGHFLGLNYKVVRRINKMKRMIQESGRNESDWSDWELSQATGLGVFQIKFARPFLQEELRLDKIVGSENPTQSETTFHDIVPDLDNRSFRSALIQQDMNEALEMMHEILDTRTMEIIASYYGFNREKENFTTIAARMGSSKSEVWETFMKGILQMRKVFSYRGTPAKTLKANS